MNNIKGVRVSLKKYNLNMIVVFYKSGKKARYCHFEDLPETAKSFMELNQKNTKIEIPLIIKGYHYADTFINYGDTGEGNWDKMIDFVLENGYKSKYVFDDITSN